MAQRILQGVVVSDKMDKTVVVRVDRRVRHKLYGKIMQRSKKYKAHDPNEVFHEGDFVKIRECNPISKDKCWIVLEGATT
ncbi:MAG: 30S ribosomal protein S17 [Magnetococcales bacterium]|nr:30S ribosomal protein S17 [Magnetococcales bacterium]